MSGNQALHKIFFRLRERIQTLIYTPVRKFWLQSQGASIGRGTSLPSLRMTWPHQVSIGSDCILENNITLKFDGVWGHGPSIIIGNRVFIGSACEFNICGRIEIGDNSLIASGCRFIDHDHGIADITIPIREQVGHGGPIVIQENVWLGVNVVVLKSVIIGSGAVVGAGAIVTKSIPANEIWAGVPARKIGSRA